MAKVQLRRLILAGIGLGLVVIIWGAFTRLVDAGLGCPDWPGCYGHLLWPDTQAEIAAAEAAFPDAPVDNDKTWPEMVHRIVAGSLVLLVFGVMVSAMRSKDPEVTPVVRLSQLLLGLILLQATFGMWTVTLKLWPQVVTAHLLGGFATLSLLWVIYLRLGGAVVLQLPAASKETLKTWRTAGLVAVIIQIMLGGWVTSNYAALACADFPTCYGSYWPDMDVASGFNIFQGVGPNYLGGLLESDARVAIHWSHRLGAVAVLLIVGWLAFKLMAHNAYLAACLLGLLTIQLTLGVLNIVWSLPLTVATLHNTFGALLLLGLVTVNFAPVQNTEHSSINHD